MPCGGRIRTGTVAAASLALVLAGLGGGVALAEETPPAVGDPCTIDTVLPSGLICVDGAVADDPAATATPAPDASTPAADPPPATEPPSPDPAPSPPATDPAPVPAAGTPGADGTPASDPAVVPDPGTAGPPAAGVPGSTGGTASGPVAGTTDGSTTTSPQAATTDPALDPATATPGPTLLSAATLGSLADGDLPSLAALRSAPLRIGTAGLPLSAYAPSPLMAGMPLADLPAGQALAVIQSPLLAAGDEAAAGGGFTLAGLSSRAVPGLLVVLATALVAAVGAGNIRLWQDRQARRRP